MLLTGLPDDILLFVARHLFVFDLFNLSLVRSSVDPTPRFFDTSDDVPIDLQNILLSRQILCSVLASCGGSSTSPESGELLGVHGTRACGCGKKIPVLYSRLALRCSSYPQDSHIRIYDP